MPHLTRNALWSLEEYAERRPAFRQEVMAHKRRRAVHLGPNVTLLFEDEITVRYQIQEMLRIERTFEAAGIQDELDVYNPLIPDGSNLKATMLIEYPDPEERAAQLQVLRGIERAVWVQAEGCPPSFAIADEDLDRENDTKTSSVHFLRFELSEAAITALKNGAALGMGIDHPAYTVALEEIAPETQFALVSDLH
ncbi:DUF3501 family protein [Denitromonas ohlonensis]|uniref:DUF3501 family protein n=2 Tax=Denitromonas TaxID=139331 RepID=A0A557SCC4_9RHOO|nr:DUF3501 family protein [Denitromonas ohlonensis]TVO59980.1 DUF3501 family protein [Denitromonas ohlonensis]TVO75054.1 DUF3501 family protein [Denitromonas ohlonensis]TVT69193.1 MAG: DUF3501 family protein [Denitromonas halophila]